MTAPLANTMPAGDARHGTYAGASEHWKHHEPLCDPCELAATRYRKRNRYDHAKGLPATIPATGTVRRIEALQALGWTHTQIATTAGVSVKTLRNPLIRGENVYRTTAEAIANAYDRLSMRLPTEVTGMQRRNATYVRNRARRNGYLPPLAWNNIDDPDERPNLRETSARESYDHAVIERFLAGEHSLHTSVPERREIVRRWVAQGRSLGELERATGWNAQRYVRREDEGEVA